MTAVIAADIETAEALRSLHDANRRFLAMCDLTVATGGELDRYATLQAIARESARLLRVEAAYVAVAGVGEIATSGHPRPVPDARRLASGAPEGLRPEVVAAGQLGLQGEQALVVPIVESGRPTGAIAFVDRIGAPFDVTDLWVAGAVAAHAAAALRTIRMHEHALETARLEAEYSLAGDVQRQLVPTEPLAVEGVSVAVRTRTALQVGGDFLDRRLASDGRVHLAVGDVSGKGMSAAMLAAVTHLALQRWAEDVPSGSPAGILAAANHETFGPLDDVGMLVTAFIGRFEPASGVLTYANGGQAPVVHLTADRRCELLLPTTVPLGVLQLPPAREERLALRPGDLLIAATDGLIEQRDPAGEPFGLSRLTSVLEHLPRDLSAEEVADTLLRTIDAWAAGVPADDDLSLLVLAPEVTA